MFFCSLPQSFCPLSLLLPSYHLLSPAPVDQIFLCCTNNYSYRHNYSHTPKCSFPSLPPPLSVSFCGKNWSKLVPSTVHSSHRQQPVCPEAFPVNTAALITLQLPQTDTHICTHSGRDTVTHWKTTQQTATLLLHR